MNKNNFDSYLCTITAESGKHKGLTATALSQHNFISKEMCFDMMCLMMMS